MTRKGELYKRIIEGNALAFTTGVMFNPELILDEALKDFPKPEVTLLKKR